MLRISVMYIQPCHNPLTDPLTKPSETVNQGRNRLMKSRIVAMPVIRSASDHRAASNLKAGTDRVDAAPAALADAAAGAPMAGAAWAAAAPAPRGAPQFEQLLS